MVQSKQFLHQIIVPSAIQNRHFELVDVTQWVEFARYTTGQKCIKITLDIAMHRYGNLLEVGNRENVEQVHEHHNRLVHLFRCVVGNDHIRRKEEQFVLETVDEQKPCFRCSVTPRVHQKIVNLKGAAVALTHTINHRGQLAVTVSLVEILNMQVVGDALDFVT